MTRNPSSANLKPIPSGTADDRVPALTSTTTSNAPVRASTWALRKLQGISAAEHHGPVQITSTKTRRNASRTCRSPPTGPRAWREGASLESQSDAYDHAMRPQFTMNGVACSPCLRLRDDIERVESGHELDGFEQQMASADRRSPIPFSSAEHLVARHDRICRVVPEAQSSTSNAKSSVVRASGEAQISQDEAPALRLRREMHARMEAYRQSRIADILQLRRVCGTEDSDIDQDDQNMEQDRPSYCMPPSRSCPALDLWGDSMADDVEDPDARAHAQRATAKKLLHARLSAEVARDRVAARRRDVALGQSTAALTERVATERVTTERVATDRYVVQNVAQGAVGGRGLQKRKLDAALTGPTEKRARTASVIDLGRVAFWASDCPILRIEPDSTIKTAGEGALGYNIKGRGDRWADGLMTSAVPLSSSSKKSNKKSSKKRRQQRAREAALADLADGSRIKEDKQGSAPRDSCSRTARTDSRGSKTPGESAISTEWPGASGPSARPTHGEAAALAEEQDLRWLIQTLQDCPWPDGLFPFLWGIKRLRTGGGAAGYQGPGPWVTLYLKYTARVREGVPDLQNGPAATLRAPV